MLTLPSEIMVIIGAFAPIFSERIWDWVQVLIVGAILAPGKRTVTSVLRVMGMSNEQQYQNYHRVLNRASWAAKDASCILLGLLVQAFVAIGVPLKMAADETLERRKGEKIAEKGVYRDAARSSRKHLVTSFGLRWVSMALLVPVPWSKRIWALPFLAVLAPSEKTNAANGKRHKTSIRWVMQMICQVRRWTKDHALILIVDGGLAAIALGHRCLQHGITLVSTLRLDARLFDWPEKQAANKPGPKPKKGQRQMALKERLKDPHTLWERITMPWYGGQERTLDITSGLSLWHTPGQDPLPIRWVLVNDPLGKLEPSAYFTTWLDASAVQILIWVVMRWGIEVTFQEVRAHLGFETQRQWNCKAIARTSPAILGLFSVVVLLAHHLLGDSPLPVRSAAWYAKSEATFSDVIAFVRYYLWTHTQFVNSHFHTRPVPIPAAVLHGLVDILCYAS